MNVDDRAGLLFDFLVANPEGVTIHEICADQNMNQTKAKDVIRALRDLLGSDDTINLVCEPQGIGPWLYRLEGNPDGARWWQINRIQDTERRIRTQHAVCSSISAELDARTVEGRKARLFKKGLGRLLEDIEDLTV